ncbi:M67 family metallopeptidase [Paenibacillus glucanolyticus]|uniref:M67 family metallopeptidase n=1 Tax=Paenibacillus glucanolyticus TaxID=59843 RepID=UPI0034CE34C5
MTPCDAPLEQLLLHAEVIEHITEHMYGCLPQEACGVLIGHSRAASRTLTVTQFIPVKNTAESPLHSFHLDPVHWTRLALTEKGLVGLFHSHPHTSPEPSREDMLQLPTFGGLLQVYVIAAPTVSAASGNHSLQLHTYKIIRGKTHMESTDPCKVNTLAQHNAESYALAPIPFDIQEG